MKCDSWITVKRECLFFCWIKELNEGRMNVKNYRKLYAWLYFYA